MSGGGDLTSVVSEHLTEWLTSPVAALIITLGFLLWMSIEMRKRIMRERQETKMALLECHANTLMGDGHLSSAMSLLGDYDSMVVSLTGVNRAVPPGYDGLRQRRLELRKAIHDARGKRICALEDQIREMRKVHEEEGLR